MDTKRTIQQTADETGLTADTLRYYEKIGLLTDIARDKSGYRAYTDADIVWIQFLKQLRATGMPISQMKRFAALRRAGDHTAKDRREMLEAHRADLIAQIDLIADFITLIDIKIERHRRTEANQKQSGDATT